MDDFAALRCEQCGAEPQLRWLSETLDGSALVPLAVGAEAALGASFGESYGSTDDSTDR